MSGAAPVSASLPTRWLLPTDDKGITELAADLQIHAPAARVLWTRGYRTPGDVQRFLRPTLDDMHDPFLLKDMHQAVARLRQALDRKEKILLYGDYDVDGATSIVVLKKALDLAGAICEFFIPHRMRDGYGMRPEVIDRAASDGVALVVSVDTGIRANAVVEHARNLGIDVIVTDHHLPDTEIPPAVAVINPNRRDCEYPEKNLCGAGVTFKLVQALFRDLDWPAERVRKLSESFLKMIAVATVADVVPLLGENRIIVKRGLEGFQDVRNPGLRALLRVAGFNPGERPTAGQVAFRLAPRINAAGRMANANDVVEMFLTSDEQRALQLATSLHDLNKERQETEAEIVKRILEICEQEPVTSSDFALVFSGSGWHRGVIGIVASRVVERYHRPVFVLSEDEETGFAQGSGRSIPVFHLLEALETMPDLFTKFGGHRQAAGITSPVERVAEFRRRLNAHASKVLTLEDLRPTIEVDAVLNLPELTDRAISEVFALGPFGCGNCSPVFAVRGAELAGPASIFKEKMLRLPIRQNGRTVMTTSWNLTNRAAEFQTGVRYDFAVCLEEENRGFGNWRLTVKEATPVKG
ncbi:MAG TPA: single-stranded-DNA-specific exonuclease RecJ [Bryobacteraceae bacterium]|nr:single-stranded-DNA-specific exonuclease RecJ [Bryobacteraceae bacterium]